MAITIKHLLGTEETIDDNTPIVRYMKLSTLLLLLADRVFLPSLRCLQSLDKYEGVLPQRMSIVRSYGGILDSRIRPFESWLLERAKGTEITPTDGSEHIPIHPRYLAKVCLEQLSIRRCVWCWNRHNGQSHALWKIYGQRGVALVSTVGDVKRAFQAARNLPRSGWRRA